MNNFCRICLEDQTNQQKLISPCNCTCTMKYVHLNCLYKWQKFKEKNFVCEICGYKLHYQQKNFIGFRKSSSKLKKYLSIDRHNNLYWMNIVFTFLYVLTDSIFSFYFSYEFISSSFYQINLKIDPHFPTQYFKISLLLLCVAFIVFQLSIFWNDFKKLFYRFQILDKL